MRRRAGLFLVAWLLSSTPVAAIAQPAWMQAADEAIRDAVAASEVPGAVLIVGQGDQILHRKVLGWRATVPHPELMTVETIFDLASLTKVVATTPAVMLLVQDGKMDLDAPVSRYLPDLVSGDEITVRMLLNHTSGIPTDGVVWDALAASGDETIEQEVRVVGAVTRAGPPLLWEIALPVGLLMLFPSLAHASWPLTLLDFPDLGYWLLALCAVLLATGGLRVVLAVRSGRSGRSLRHLSERGSEDRDGAFRLASDDPGHGRPGHFPPRWPTASENNGGGPQ